jgi:hypothetical protein
MTRNGEHWNRRVDREMKINIIARLKDRELNLTPVGKNQHQPLDPCPGVKNIKKQAKLKSAT